MFLFPFTYFLIILASLCVHARHMWGRHTFFHLWGSVHDMCWKGHVLFTCGDQRTVLWSCFSLFNSAWDPGMKKSHGQACSESSSLLYCENNPYFKLQKYITKKLGF